MIKLKFMVILCLAVFIAAMNGCLPVPTTTRSGFFIVNKSDAIIQYQVRMSNIWSQKANIEPDVYDYIYGYEIEEKEHNPPDDIQLLRLYTQGCKLELTFENFKDYIIRNSESRTAWDLVISNSLFMEQGCLKATN